MDIHINFNEKSGDKDFKKEVATEDISFVPDAGAPPADLGPSAKENLDYAYGPSDSEAEDLDIGGPADWLVEAMDKASAEEEDLSDDDITDGIDDGGSGPVE